MQYNADGSLDTTFGTGGSAVAQINAGNDFANSVTVEQDGTLVLAGNGSGTLALARFTSNAIPPAFTLSVSTAGSGTVSSSPAGITCGADCTELYNSGTVVTLTAAAAAGAVFTGWSGDCSGTSTCQVTMNAARSVVATFSGPSGEMVTRFRLYSPATFEHLYTTDTFEYAYLSNQVDPACCGWNGEGAVYRLFKGPGTWAGVAAVPYYRLYNPTSHQHHWTTEAVEYNFLPSVGWQQEGIDGYILPSQASGTLPLYRLYINAAGGLHLWTTDANERAYLIANAGWSDEGIAGYVIPLP